MKLALLNTSQIRVFNQEFIDLKANHQFVEKRSILRTLNPFLDEDCLIHIVLDILDGSRLTDSSLVGNSKFPIVLPSRLYLSTNT